VDNIWTFSPNQATQPRGRRDGLSAHWDSGVRQHGRWITWHGVAADDHAVAPLAHRHSEVLDVWRVRDTEHEDPQAPFPACSVNGGADVSGNRRGARAGHDVRACLPVYSFPFHRVVYDDPVGDAGATKVGVEQAP
jgi:hypothetical protein